MLQTGCPQRSLDAAQATRCQNHTYQQMRIYSLCLKCACCRLSMLEEGFGATETTLWPLELSMQ